MNTFIQVQKILTSLEEQDGVVLAHCLDPVHSASVVQAGVNSHVNESVPYPATSLDLNLMKEILLLVNHDTQTNKFLSQCYVMLIYTRGAVT